MKTYVFTYSLFEIPLLMFSRLLDNKLWHLSQNLRENFQWSVQLHISFTLKVDYPGLRGESVDYVKSITDITQNCEIAQHKFLLIQSKCSKHALSRRLF